MVNKPLTTRQQQARLRREQILEVALRLFAQQGFTGTSTKQIAREAGIAEGLIFHYFPSKEDLLTAVLESRHSYIHDLRALLTNTDERPVFDVLIQLSSGWLATLRRESGIVRVLLSEAQINPQVSTALQAVIQEGVSRLSTYLYARVQAGELRADLPVETSARMFLSSLIVFFMNYHTVSAAEWDQYAARFTMEMLSVWLEGTRT